jgi:hypothetical protein
MKALVSTITKSSCGSGFYVAAVRKDEEVESYSEPMESPSLWIDCPDTVDIYYYYDADSKTFKPITKWTEPPFDPSVPQRPTIVHPLG